MVHQVATERSVFLAGSWQHCDEATTAPVDVLHVHSGGELAIGDVAEVAPSKQRTQAVPGGDVGGRVLGVARGDPTGDGDGSIG